nr:putative RNA-directed DNA polymerase, eukaryota, reverse transcriptase zinc-binding domain protein [Tanacetum cinerariifolium]
MLIFKVYFEKAFDSVSWRYLDYVLLSFGFGSKCRSWIRDCLQSSRASILINGSPSFEFSIKRGLQQGDPLSPFLFNLAMEGLHGAMSNAVNSGLILDLDNIIQVLHVFHPASGNIHKSNIYGIGVSNDEVSSMASRTECVAGSIPFTYLGLLIGSNMNLTSIWNILVERSLGIYYLSIFKAPDVILKSLERLCSRFFWAVLTTPRVQRGLNGLMFSLLEKGGLRLSTLPSFKSGIGVGDLVGELVRELAGEVVDGELVPGLLFLLGLNDPFTIDHRVAGDKQCSCPDEFPMLSKVNTKTLMQIGYLYRR